MNWALVNMLSCAANIIWALVLFFVKSPENLNWANVVKLSCDEIMYRALVLLSHGLEKQNGALVFLFSCAENINWP